MQPFRKLINVASDSLRIERITDTTEITFGFGNRLGLKQLASIKRPKFCICINKKAVSALNLFYLPFWGQMIKLIRSESSPPDANNCVSTVVHGALYYLLEA